MQPLSQVLPPSATTTPEGHLSVGGCDVVALAEEFGTPLVIYDGGLLRDTMRRYVTAFRAHDASAEVIYASKAFWAQALLRMAHEEGLRVDVASGGELFMALHAGFPADKIVMHGNAKDARELGEALDAMVGLIVVDGLDEIALLDRLAGERGRTQDVLVRVTPGVKPSTHQYISTGQIDSKFGFSLEGGLAAAAVAACRAAPNVNLVGLHCHIGSNVLAVSSFARAAEVMARFANPLDLPELTLGGGLGVAYLAEEEAPTITSWAGVLTDACQALGVRAKVMVEPGRSIVASAAVTVYEVGTIKHIDGVRTYVAVDGGMSDNPRPVLYGSGYEVFLPRAPLAERPRRCRLVGKHCESGDVLVFDAAVPGDLSVGDLLATPVTGAYGHSMGSNYNKVPRPPVVFVADGTVRLVVRRETDDDLLRCDLDIDRA